MLERPRKGINLGVTLMLLAGLPAIVASLSTPIAMPAALLLLVLGYGVVLLGSGPLMKAFGASSNELIEVARRELRRDIAFGSTLMFLGIILVTGLVAFAPDSWQKIKRFLC